MIVQCQHCSAKYRIPDEKIKGRGVKVKCAKCQKVFTVEPPEASEVRAAPAPAPPEPPAPPVPEKSPPPPEKSALPPAGPPMPAGLSPLEPGSPAETEPPPPDSQPGPGLSFEEAFRSGQSLDLGYPPPSPAPEAPAAPEEPAQPAPEPGKMEWGNISLGEHAGGEESSETGFGLAGQFAASGKGEELEPQPPPPFPTSPEPMEEREAQPAGSSRTPTRVSAAAPGPSGGGRKGLVALLVLLALGAAGYFGYTTAYPRIMNLLGKGAPEEQGTLLVEGVQVTAVPLSQGISIVAVRGTVRNGSESNKGMIKVEAQFKDSNGQVVKKATAYCGNTFTDRELASRPSQDIRAAMENELGQSLRNSSIAPGKSVPFLVVLENPPLNIQQVTVTVLEWQNTM